MTLYTLHRQQGLTLTELMVSIAISMILVLAVIGLYVGSKRGFSATDGVGQQQENIRFSVDLLLHDLRMAGYPKATAGIAPIVTAADDSSGGSDSITLQYQSATDCLGQPTAGVAINKYYIDNNGNLTCLGNGGATADIVATNIHNMQLLYGLDTNKDCVADKYVKWSNVSDPSQIVSVRIGLISRTPTDIYNSDTTKTYNNLDQAITTNDKRFHQVYSSTVVLRNANSIPDNADCQV